MKSILTLFLIFTIFSFFSQTDDCGSASSLAVNTSCTTSAFLVDADGTSPDGNASCATGTVYDDHWYTVIGTGNTMTVTISGTSRDASLAAFTSCVSGEITCAMVVSGGSGSINFATTNGTTYLIQIQRRSGNNTNNLTGNICAVSAAPAGVGNDLCSGAISVICGGTYAGTTVGSTTTGETTLPSCSNTSPSAGGVWYVYTGNGSIVTASLCAGTSYDSKLNVYSGTGACGTMTTCVASDDDGCSSQSTVTFTTSVGTNYYILVNGYSSATGTFSLAISCCTPGAPSCATSPSPANAAVGINVSTCATNSLSWTPPASGCSAATSYDIYFGTAVTPPFVVNQVGTSYTTPALSPSTTYYWQIRPKNSGGTSAGCTIWSFTTAAAPALQYTLVDDAASPSPYTCVNLTSAIGDQRGCAWDVNSTLNFTSNFSYDFTVNLGSSDGGGDGIAFTMQNDPLGRCKCGTNGGALGSGGILNSVIVEIDTYINTEDRDDFNTSFIGCGGSEDPDHIDIWYNGNINPDNDGDCNATGAGERTAAPTAVRLRNGGSNYNIENGSNHILRIAWNAVTTTLTATVFNTALSTNYGTISTSFNPMTIFGTNTPFFGFTASTGGVNNSQTFCNPPVLLPVELMSFNTYCYENYRKINWSTASENNNAFFTLEKSLDGINFEVFEIISPSGLKSSTSNYEVLDKDIQSKIIYYRLSQTDFNGVSKSFDVISSNCKNKTNSLSFEGTNENNNELEIYYSATKEIKHEFIVVDLSGKIIYKEETNPNKGLNKITFKTDLLASGMYLLQLTNPEEKANLKYIK